MFKQPLLYHESELTDICFDPTAARLIELLLGFIGYVFGEFGERLINVDGGWILFVCLGALEPDSFDLGFGLDVWVDFRFVRLFLQNISNDFCLFTRLLILVVQQSLIEALTNFYIIVDFGWKSHPLHLLKLFLHGSIGYSFGFL